MTDRHNPELQSSTEDSGISSSDDLRKRAEDRFHEKLYYLEAEYPNLKPGEVAGLVNELRVHQIELELVNEDLRTTQIQLEKSRETYFDLYEISPVGYITIGTNGLILFANLTAASLLGTEKQRLLGRLLTHFIHPSDKNTFMLSAQAAFDSGIKHDVEVRMVGQPDQWFYAHLEILPILDLDQENGVKTCRVAIIDVTEKKLAQDTLKAAHESLEQQVAERTTELTESKRRLNWALEGADMGMWELKLQTGEQFFDERMAKLLGYSFDEMGTDPEVWRGLIHPDDQQKVSDAFQRHLNGDTPSFNSEYRIRTKSGIWKWILARGKLVEHDASGKPLRVAGTCVDITRRKEAEQELQESEERFRKVFDSVPDIIILKDENRRITHVNPAFSHLLEKPISELIGLRVEDYFDSPYSDQLRELDRRVLAGETIETEHTRPYHGVPMTFLDVRTPLRDEDGKVIGICVVSRDVTGRRKPISWESQVEEYPSPAMQKTMAIGRQCAESDAFILLQGESGSGKDYLAKWVHDHSPRSSGPFFSINCATLPEQMLESELFGHERGAFTGAVSRKRGLVELAEGGTLLLNEIGELPFALQSKLLTFLDTKRFQRLGSEKSIQVNARLMAASHRDLKQEVRQGRFLGALYYRVNVLTIRIPPLRERLEDLPVLVQQIIADVTRDIPSPRTPHLAPGSFKRLSAYHWPGNIRELRNVLERAVILTEGNEIDLKLPQDMLSEPLPAGDGDEALNLPIKPDDTLAEAKNELIRTMCKHAIKRFGGNKKAAAESLGVSRDALYRYLRELDIKV